jgi:hypothetical protein
MSQAKMNNKGGVMEFCELSIDQDGPDYHFILTVHNEGDSPQQLAWDVHLPAALAVHREVRITGKKILYQGKSQKEILFSKSLVELSGNQVSKTMKEEPITAKVTLGSKTAKLSGTWNELSRK